MTNKILLTTMLSLPIFALAIDKDPVSVNRPTVVISSQTNNTIQTPTSEENVVIEKAKLIPNTLSGINVQKVAKAPKFANDDISDNRITNINYNANRVVTIYANHFVSTTLEFSKDEVVRGDNITNGDSSSWNYQVYADKPNYLGIKPSRIGSDTSMTIVTNKRTYYFHLLSTDKTAAMFAIKYNYPDQELKDITAKQQFIKQQQKANLSEFRNPAQYNMNYTFSGDKNIMPIQVWDDGTVTYMQFSPNQPQPALFAVEGTEGDEAVVNYRRLKNNLVMVLRVSPQFTLRLGSEQVASIFNQTYIQQIKEKQSNYHNNNFFDSALSYFQSDDIATSNDK
jgi:type IV secretion system protein VirB9